MGQASQGAGAGWRMGGTELQPSQVSNYQWNPKFVLIQLLPVAGIVYVIVAPGVYHALSL